MAEEFLRGRTEENRRAIDAERSSWRALGDRTTYLAATTLGLSVVFLTRDLALDHTPVIRFAWVVLTLAVLSGLARYFLDWVTIRNDQRFEAPWYAFRGIARTSQLASQTFMTLSVLLFVIGLLALVAFAWLNLGEAVQIESSTLPN